MSLFENLSAVIGLGTVRRKIYQKKFQILVEKTFFYNSVFQEESQLFIVFFYLSENSKDQIIRQQESQLLIK